MTGEVLVKQALKWGVGRASLCLASVGRQGAAPAIILMYHRVAPLPLDWTVDSWNVTPERFVAQMHALATQTEVVSLQALITRAGQPEVRTRPLVAVTFDDGYAGLMTHALPVLERWRLPATFFVATAFVEHSTPMPFDRWATRHPDASHGWRPLRWTEIDRCLQSGLVTFGGHSHRHLPGHTCSAAQLLDETATSREILVTRIGDAHGYAYAFPYGSRRLGHVPERYVTAARTAGYACAVTTDPGVVHAGISPWTLPRVEACAVDSPAVLLAKCRGALQPLRLTEVFRRRRRWRDNGDLSTNPEGAAHVSTTAP